MLFKSLRLNDNLRAKVTLATVIPLIVILGAFTLIEYTRHQQTVLDNLSVLASYSGRVIESNLRHAMLKSDFEEVQSLLDTTGSSKEFRVVYLLNTSGKVIFAPGGKGVGTFLDNRAPDCMPCHRLSPDSRPGSIVVTVANDQRVFRSMHPIENGPECARCHGNTDRLLGLLLTDISTTPLESPIAADFSENLLWWLGTLFVTVIVVNLVMDRFMFRRLEALARAISDLGKGQLPQFLPEEQPDEIGKLVSAFNVMARQIEAREADNRVLSDGLQLQSAQRGELLRRLITAQEDERKRVARDLHDELGQALGGLALQSGSLKRLVTAKPEQALRQIETIEALISQTTDHMYDLIRDLRPSALDDMGLAVALRNYAELLLKGKDIAFTLNTSDLNRRLPPPVEISLYRTFQEALTNIVKHADARSVEITLSCQNNIFNGEIADNGHGFDVASVQADGNDPRGWGLLGMRERITQCGGQMKIISEAEGGTRIRLTIPLMEVFSD